LVRAVCDTGTPTVLVLVHGRPYAIEWMAEHVPAIVEAWYPGEEGGNALADILFGKVNPSGKLPLSVPRSVGHVPVFYNHKPSARGYYRKPGSPEAPGRDYVFSESTPRFEFGHGLSYTTFRYTNLRLSPRKIRPGGRVSVSVDVANSGKLAGKEVVQLYVNDVVSSVTTPVKALKRFEKVSLKPGERKTVSFVLTPADLELLDENMNRVVEPGAFEVIVGNLKKRFEVAG
jgi:beta-glucosidase